MPVPRLFEAPAEPRDQWAHVLASLLTITGPETRAAFLAELVGDVVEGAGSAQVAERRPFTAPAPVVADIVVRSGADWGVAVQVDFGYDVDRADTWRAVYDALDAAVEQAILVVVTPDRRPPADVVAAAEGRDIRHRSWQRVRDWVQERPERGAATGADALLLREGDYFLQSRVAEMYRVEALMPMMRPEVRGSFVSLFTDLNDISPQPYIQQTGDTTAVVRYPRSGDTLVSIAVGDGDPVLTVSGAEPVVIDSPQAYSAARSGAQAAARAVLPPRR